MADMTRVLSADDATERLILADWLLDHGRTGEADLVRSGRAILADGIYILRGAGNDLFRRMAGWRSDQIAEHYGCGWDGDLNAYDHGCLFYDDRDRAQWGYANFVELYRHYESDSVLRVRSGTINRPDGHTIDRVYEPDQERRYPDATWKEWRVWKAINPLMSALGDRQRAVR